MNTYPVILFDLDGTLSDPKIGITKSVQFALKKMNIIETDLDKLVHFIGPPLQVTFPELYQFDEKETEKAIHFYRERFKEKGMFENELYPYVTTVLKALKEQKFTLVVATSKPTVFAEQILKYFNIDHYFDLVVGSNLDGTRISKTEIIQYILNTYKQHPLADFIMIGDRKQDIIGAKNTGITSVGVTYGYGSEEEIRPSNPTYIVDSVRGLEGILITKRVN